MEGIFLRSVLYYSCEYAVVLIILNDYTNTQSKRAVDELKKVRTTMILQTDFCILCACAGLVDVQSDKTH